MMRSCANDWHRRIKHYARKLGDRDPICPTCGAVRTKRGQELQDKDDARRKLLEWLKPGDTVYTILRNVSRSGMQREIGLVISLQGELIHPNYSAGLLLGYRRGKGDGLIVGGCGMDMGFHLVYNLSRSLWPDGFDCIDLEGGGRVCPSNDHSNGEDREHHPDGGYALRHRWL